MQASNLPTKVPLPFANSGTKNTIPTASQIGITAGAASLTDGFPPLTFTPLASGGVPPAGADFNGILNLITGVQQWQSAGGIFKYDSAFSTSVGGYPKGAILESSDGSTLWLCLADNNTTDPDGATPSNWAPAASYGIAAVTGLTNANVTLTPAQYGKSIITLAGTLTGNVQIIFPATEQQWVISNTTTGAFSVTAKTASGSGVAIPQGQLQSVYGDGANILFLFAPSSGNPAQIFKAASFIPNGSTVPTNGMYLPGANQLGFSTNSTNALSIDSLGRSQLSAAAGVGQHVIQSAGAENATVLAVQGSAMSFGTAVFYATNGGSASGAETGIAIQKNSTTSRSINAAGTLNASGADYAEYMRKAVSCGTVAKGQIVGITKDGEITDKWGDSISFAVKSTNPSYVGGDTWAADVGEKPQGPTIPTFSADASESEHQLAMETYDAKLAAYGAALKAFESEFEAVRQTVDRIAFCGQVPINVLGASVGDYIVPNKDGDRIKGVPVSMPTLAQYMQAVGRVIAIEPDGRARIIVKVA